MMGIFIYNNLFRFWLDNVNCNGNEESIQNCPHNPWGSHNCDSSNSCIKLYCLAGGP